MAKIYRVDVSFMDTENGYAANKGDFIETDCVKWVARLGSMTEVREAKSGAKVIKIGVANEDPVAAEPAKLVAKKPLTAKTEE